MKLLKFILLLIAAILVSVFAANNDQAVTINLYPLSYEFSASFFFIIFIAVLFGVLIGGTALSFKVYYWKRVAGSAKHRAEKLEKKIISSDSNKVEVR